MQPRPWREVASPPSDTRSIELLLGVTSTRLKTLFLNLLFQIHEHQGGVTRISFLRPIEPGPSGAAHWFVAGATPPSVRVAVGVVSGRCRIFSHRKSRIMPARDDKKAGAHQARNLGRPACPGKPLQSPGQRDASHLRRGTLHPGPASRMTPRASRNRAAPPAGRGIRQPGYRIRPAVAAIARSKHSKPRSRPASIWPRPKVGEGSDLRPTHRRPRRTPHLAPDVRRTGRGPRRHHHSRPRSPYGPPGRRPHPPHRPTTAPRSPVAAPSSCWQPPSPSPASPCTPSSWA